VLVSKAVHEGWLLMENRSCAPVGAFTAGVKLSGFPAIKVVGG
jgi:hypothetical protein